MLRKEQALTTGGLMLRLGVAAAIGSLAGLGAIAADLVVF